MTRPPNTEPSNFMIDKLGTYLAPGVSVDVGDVEITFIDDKTLRFRSSKPPQSNADLREAIEELLVNTGRWGHISCAVEADPADGFGYCSCGLESEVIKPLAKLFQARELQLMDDIEAGKIPYFEGVVIPKRQQQLLTELLGALPEKRELLEPVTKRVVTEVGDKVGIDVDADLRGSLKFVQDNGYNMAISEVVSAIEKYREGL